MYSINKILYTTKHTIRLYMQQQDQRDTVAHTQKIVFVLYTITISYIYITILCIPIFGLKTPLSLILVDGVWSQ